MIDKSKNSSEIDLSVFDVDMTHIQGLDDKYKEFKFFLKLLSQYNNEQSFSEYRWVLSAVINVADSYFDTMASQTNRFHMVSNEKGTFILHSKEAEELLKPWIKIKEKENKSKKKIYVHITRVDEALKILHDLRIRTFHHGLLDIKLKDGRFVFNDEVCSSVDVDSFLDIIEKQITKHHNAVKKLR